MDRRWFLGGSIVAMGGGWWGYQAYHRWVVSRLRQSPKTVHVAESDSGVSNGTRSHPFGSIQTALEVAHPGDTVLVHPGEYVETLSTVRDGGPGEPITISGPTDAVLRAPSRTSDLISVKHSHIHFRGMTMTGLADPDSPDELESYAGNIVEMTPSLESEAYLTDLVFRPHRIGHARRALVSVIRVSSIDIGAFRVIGGAGARNYVGDIEGHNAEIVYVGTAPANLSQDWYPWDEPDFTHDVRVHHIDASAAPAHTELVDVKLGCHDVTIEHCTSVGARLPTDNDNGSAVHLGGTDTTFRWNRIESPEHHGIDVGNYGPYNEHVPHPDAPDAGTDNAIYGNEFLDVSALAINYTEETSESAQQVVCGNVVDGETEGSPERACSEGLPAGNGIGHTGGDSPW